MKPEDVADFCASMTCQCCNDEPGVGVASIPGIPCSIMWGADCVTAGVIPMWAAVANTALAGELSTCAEWWQEIVTRTLAYFDVSLSDFNTEVAQRIADLDALAEAEQAFNAALPADVADSCGVVAVYVHIDGCGQMHYPDDPCPTKINKGEPG